VEGRQQNLNAGREEQEEKAIFVKQVYRKVGAFGEADCSSTSEHERNQATF
jgi:hypothetical protein